MKQIYPGLLEFQYFIYIYIDSETVQYLNNVKPSLYSQ